MHAGGKKCYTFLEMSVEIFKRLCLTNSPKPENIHVSTAHTNLKD